MWPFLRRVGLLFWRALRLRCPHCAGGPIFDSWLRMRQHCPRCGLLMMRGEQGYQVGSYMFSSMALMVIVPFLFFPFSKTLFLAFDLVFRPPSPGEFVTADTPGRA